MSGESFDKVLYEVADGVATVTLNDPEKRNMPSGQMLSELVAAMEMARDSDEARAVVFTGAGDRVFCAGADLAGKADDQVAILHASELRDLEEITWGELRRQVAGVAGGGAPLSERSHIQDWIAEARIELEMLRLLTLKTAWMMDTVGNRHAGTEIAAIKAAAPNIALTIIDRAIQVHGGAGVSQDFLLAWMYAHVRTLRLADGPDEVHNRTIAQGELRRRQSA